MSHCCLLLDSELCGERRKEGGMEGEREGGREEKRRGERIKRWEEKREEGGGRKEWI